MADRRLARGELDPETLLYVARWIANLMPGTTLAEVEQGLLRDARWWEREIRDRQRRRRKVRA